MKIYTKTGDKGETGLFGGKRVGKDDPRIEAYGTVDELNSFLGLVREFDDRIGLVQNRLFDLGAALATPGGQKEKVEKKGAVLNETDIRFLEGWIDEAEGKLPPIRNFILPGGTVTAARFHLARTVCRRAERQVVALSRKEPVDPEILVWINRLSDLLFVLARLANGKEGIKDVAWEKKGKE